MLTFQGEPITKRQTAGMTTYVVKGSEAIVSVMKSTSWVDSKFCTKSEIERAKRKGQTEEKPCNVLMAHTNTHYIVQVRFSGDLAACRAKGLSGKQIGPLHFSMLEEVDYPTIVVSNHRASRPSQGHIIELLDLVTN